jgi:hypothetical protein
VENFSDINPTEECSLNWIQVVHDSTVYFVGAMIFNNRHLGIIFLLSLFNFLGGSPNSEKLL